MSKKNKQAQRRAKEERQRRNLMIAFGVIAIILLIAMFIGYTIIAEG